jgi:hypothetical protein
MLHFPFGNPKWFHHVLPLNVLVFIAHLGTYLVAKCKGFFMAQIFIYFFFEDCVQKTYTFSEPKMETKSKYFSCK